MSDLRARLADALQEPILREMWLIDDPDQGWAERVADVLLSLPGIAIVELPVPDSTRYEGDEHAPMDRMAWGTGSKFAVSHWEYPEVQIAYDDEPFEPISIRHARWFAAALLAAANAADTAEVRP